MTERLTPEQYHALLAGNLPKPRTKPGTPAADLELAKRRADAERLENAFLAAWRAIGGPEPERQYEFHAERRWRFDFAWPAQLVAVEIHGGVWSGGAHVRGGGITRDAEKQRAAVDSGWKVLAYTTADMADPVGVANEVARILAKSE